LEFVLHLQESHAFEQATVPVSQQHDAVTI
jgi:hypothetical protein